MKEKQVLVTGGTGFVGAYLLRHLLQSGYKNIRALKRRTSSMALVEDIQNDIEWVECDIMDVSGLEEAMAGVKYLYHSAAIVSFNPSEYDKIIQVNAGGTANVVNAALNEGIDKMVHVSSIAALGRKKKETHHDESFKWESNSANSGYAISKHLAEMEIHRGIAEGLKAAIVNPSNVLGSGFWKDRTSTGQFFHLTWKGFPFYAQGGSGFVDVRDVVRFCRILMESDIVSERFILNGENLSFQQLFSEIASALNVRAPFIQVGPITRELSWRLMWIFSKLTGKTQIITRETARSSARRYTYDNGKSLSVFPEFKYTPIRETIEQTGKQFLEACQTDFKPMVLPFNS